MRALLFAALVPIAAIGAAAQQRQPAFEIYALSGGYFHGNLTVAHDWRPQGGTGILAPVGRRWGVLVDVTTSAIEGTSSPSSPVDARVRERRVTITPSVVHLWRRGRFSVYAGGGVGQEHERQHVRYRPVGGPLVDAGWSRTDTTLLLRLGAIVSVSRKLVLRADFSVLPRYVDEAPSKGLTVGMGYRF